jgi:hypothetical protein
MHISYLENQEMTQPSAKLDFVTFLHIKSQSLVPNSGALAVQIPQILDWYY